MAEHDPRSLESRLDDLARRLDRIEKFLELGDGQAAHPPTAPPHTPPSAPARPAASSPPAARSSAPAAIAVPDSAIQTVPPTAPPTSASTAYPPTSARSSARTRPGRQREPISLEMFIGGRGMAWVGAIVIIISIGLFMKLAYDQGWLKAVSPLQRILAASVFGVFLLAAGELALRKVSRFASVGLFCAGLGVLYISAHSTTWESVSILDQGAAGLLMMLVAGLGFAVSVRGGFLSIGILTIVAGYATPILVNEAQSFTGALAIYLTMLLGIALALSAFRPRPFRALRYVTLVCHGFIGFVWVAAEGANAPALTLIFLSGWWCLVNGEAVFAAIRRTSAIGNVIATVLTTAWVVTVMTLVFDNAPSPWPVWSGMYATSLCVLSIVMVFQFGPGLDALRRSPKLTIDALGIAHWFQAGVLAAVAIALQFDQYGQSIGWLALGLASIEIGRRIRARSVEIFGLVVGGLGVARVATIDLFLSSLTNTPILTLFDERITIMPWTLLAIGAIAVVLTAAKRLRPSDRGAWTGIAIALTAIATGGYLLIVPLHTSDQIVTWLWLCAPVALIACERLGRRERFLEIAIFALGFIGARWILGDALLPRVTRSEVVVETTPIINAQLGLALTIVIIAAWGIWTLLRRNTTGTTAGIGSDVRRQVFAQIAAVIGVVFLLMALSFEVDRMLEQAYIDTNLADRTWPPAQELAIWLTGLWGLGGTLTFALAHFRRSWPIVQAACFVILIVAACVWLSVDTIAIRISRVPADVMIFLNIQCIVGAVLIASLAIAHRLLVALQRRKLLEDVEEHTRRFPPVHEQILLSKASPQIALGFIALFGLVAGSLEIDRFFEPSHSSIEGAAMARQAALSTWWGLYALALIAIGFVKRVPVSRYAGLALLIVILGKVFIVDLSEIEAIYRVLSFLAVGLLAVVTSIAYARYASRILDDRTQAENAKSESSASAGPDFDRT